MIGPFSHAEWVAIITIGVGFPVCGFLGFLLGTTAKFHKGEPPGSDWDTTSL